jgi:hypothetical protein
MLNVIDSAKWLKTEAYPHGIILALRVGTTTPTNMEHGKRRAKYALANYNVI